MDIPDYDSDEEKVPKNVKNQGKGQFGVNLTGWNELFLKD